MQFLIFLILKIVEIYSYLLLAYALLSWFPNLYATPLGRFIQWAVAPMLKPFRRLNLQFMGLDWTVMVAMIALNIGTRILIRILLLLA
ncbi:YggT family protein [Streptococcus parasuis]|uniref:YggT family protein n=1 Tax=Streptococcus parasuis TaxID=1501662 RepID=A0A4Q8L3E5_9STRE|nr:YggT family protein [Streptococcus parasuis]TAA14493.1 YggT family protein [Streptococcus parasuis]